MCISGPLLAPKRLLKYQVPKNSKKVQFLAPEKKPKYMRLRPILTPKRLQVPENSKKVHFLVPEKAKMASLKTPKRYIIWGQKMPKCVSLRPLLTPKRPPKYQVPNNSKKVQFLAPENVKICTFKAPFNFKLVSPISCAGKLQKGAFFGAKKNSK